MSGASAVQGAAMMQTCLGRGERAAEHEATEHGRVAVLAFAEPDPNLHEVIPGERSGNAVSQRREPAVKRVRLQSARQRARTDCYCGGCEQACGLPCCSRPPVRRGAVAQPPGLVRRDAFVASRPTFSVARVRLPQRRRRSAQRRAAAAAAGTTEEDTARATRVGGAGAGACFPAELTGTSSRV